MAGQTFQLAISAGANMSSEKWEPVRLLATSKCSTKVPTIFLLNASFVSAFHDAHGANKQNKLQQEGQH